MCSRRARHSFVLEEANSSTDYEPKSGKHYVGATGWTIGFGPGKAPAFTMDIPEHQGARTNNGRMIMHFETAAFCIDTQQVLGVIQWGYEIANTNVADIVLWKGTRADFSLTASTEFKGLVAQANTVASMKIKVSAPNTAKCDCGGTSALP